MPPKLQNRVSRLVGQLKEYREWAALVQEQTGKGLLTQLREISALKQAGGRCGITDYYWYKLYDDTYQKGRGAPDFLGWRLEQPFNLALNPRHAVLPAWDKIAFIQLAAAAGLPVTPVRACFHRAAQLPEILGRHLKTRQDAAKFLRGSENYPLFAKPAYSQQGYGSAYLTGYDSVSDSLSLLDGNAISIESFLNRLETPIDHRYHKPECGFLFLEPLKLAPEILPLTGWPAICGVRIICLNGPDGVRPIGAAWKIATPPNFVDNFHMGSYGNLVADINTATGEVGKVVDNLWPKTKIFHQHPHTCQPFTGFSLPGWDQLLAACQLGGAVFPLMKIHHWDFALTNAGPVILELNDLGGTQITQLHGRGLLTEETREFLKRQVNAQAHPWIKAL